MIVLGARDCNRMSNSPSSLGLSESDTVNIPLDLIALRKIEIKQNQVKGREKQSKLICEIGRMVSRRQRPKILRAEET